MQQTFSFFDLLIMFCYFYLNCIAVKILKNALTAAGTQPRSMHQEGAKRQCPLYSTSSDSPVIYGVRVETSNPYHLLYIENVIQFTVLSYQPRREKSSALFRLFSHFLMQNFVNCSQITYKIPARHRSWKRFWQAIPRASPRRAYGLRRPETPSRLRCLRRRRLPPPARTDRADR